MRTPLDKQSFDQAVVEHLPVLMRVATRLVGTADRAEDLTQEALLRMARSWRSFRGDSQFRTWACRIMINVFRDWERRKRPEIQLAQETVDHRDPSPEQVCEGEELRRVVASAISSLPPRQREVIVLTVFEGFSAGEVARSLDIEISNVYATLSLARQRLGKALSRYVECG